MLHVSLKQQVVTLHGLYAINVGPTERVLPWTMVLPLVSPCSFWAE